jgi:hypothetical protein
MHIKMKILSIPAFATCAILALALDARADVIDFNTLGTGSYFLSSVTSNGYIFTPGYESSMGTMTNFDGDGQTDGSVYLGSWSNYVSQTLFSFDATDSSLFSLQSFDFDNAYPGDYNRTGTLTVTGVYQNGSTTSQTFSNLGNVLGFTELDLNTSFAGLESVSVAANAVPGQSDTRALFDNFTVNAAPASVPESGATVSLLGGALLCLGALRRKFARA